MHRTIKQKRHAKGPAECSVLPPTTDEALFGEASPGAAVLGADAAKPAAPPRRCLLRRCASKSKGGVQEATASPSKQLSE